MSGRATRPDFFLNQKKASVIDGEATCLGGVLDEAADVTSSGILEKKISILLKYCWLMALMLVESKAYQLIMNEERLFHFCSFLAQLSVLKLYEVVQYLVFLNSSFRKSSLSFKLSNPRISVS